ncbi:MAG TPA: (d)CMP kinase [Sedimentisphaerales bacterium]|nr:(d)CMP kinase [Sedimentisphaerales bacterium]
MDSFIITIDGPAGSGKSTIAALLAKKLSAAFLDTGAMYRTVTLAAMNDNINMNNASQLLTIFDNNDFSFSIETDKTTTKINGKDVTKDIRSPEITANVKYIASNPKLREKLVQMQRNIAGQYKKIVTEGRDQGTVAFKDADIKFFLTASVEERAKRRLLQLQTNGDNSQTLENTKAAIIQRDLSDSSRTTGPLKPADNAITVDTSDLNIEQVVEKLLSYVRQAS